MKRNVCIEARSRALINMSFLWFYDTFTKCLIRYTKKRFVYYTHFGIEMGMGRGVSLTNIRAHTNICHAKDAFLTAMLHHPFALISQIKLLQKVFSFNLLNTNAHMDSIDIPSG